MYILRECFRRIQFTNTDAYMHTCVYAYLHQTKITSVYLGSFIFILILKFGFFPAKTKN